MPNTLTFKYRRVSIRVYEEDIDTLREMAYEEGLPYQTFITSLLHKIAIGRLVDKKDM